MSHHDWGIQSRRQFFGSWGAFIAGTSVSVSGAESSPSDSVRDAEPKGFGDITPHAIQSMETILGLSLSADERTQMVPGLRRHRDQYLDRRAGGSFENHQAPALVFNPRLPGQDIRRQENRVQLAETAASPLPAKAEDIAFAPLTHLSEWIRTRQLTSERLTEIYLERLVRFDPLLHCVVTLNGESAMRQARLRDRELSEGHYRGPLHGIPWGAKDLFDVAGGRTTWGAMPYKDRVSEKDAYVVRRLEEAGAVLVAKLTLGALAMGDVWFDDITRNPFKPAQGSSGSSAGSASATAAGLVGFSLGTETLGSIVSPCMRCGTTGLRPTFGRVARTGAMALCWSLDKIGPICRTVDDTALVLAAINGADSGDASSVDHGFEYDGLGSVQGLRVGYSPEWFQGEGKAVERNALAKLNELGVNLVEISMPDLRYGDLYTILNVEAAAAFEALTLENRDNLLVRQTDGAWPNQFRKSWFVPAVELIQADRLRRQVMESMAEVMRQVDGVISPSFSGSLLIATNFTGHPSLTVRAGFREDGTPTGVTLWGRLYEEGRLCRLGNALEKQLDVWGRRPDLEG